jgi:hypothetical protein
VFGQRGYVRDGHMFGFVADTGMSVKSASADAAG